MSNALVYVTAAVFFIAVFPLHVYNYVYFSSMEKYASLNVSLYRIIPVFNLNTVKNSITKMSVNGSERDVNTNIFKENPLKAFNNMCITKIVQLGDYGVKSQTNVYAAFIQNSLTQAVYTFVKINGGKTKLRNYVLFNYEHDKINYYLKIVGVINLISISKMLLILFMEKINERKNSQIAKRQLKRL